MFHPLFQQQHERKKLDVLEENITQNHSRSTNTKFTYYIILISILNYAVFATFRHVTYKFQRSQNKPRKASLNSSGESATRGVAVIALEGYFLKKFISSHLYPSCFLRVRKHCFFHREERIIIDKRRKLMNK